MSDFLKKFKSVFIVEEAQAAAAPAAQSVQKPDSQPTVPQAAAPRPAAAGAVTDKFMGILSAALEANNPPGFDYFEFRQSLNNLAQMQMDEATRFKSAYAMSQTMGVTQQGLMQSAQHYLQVLGAEQAKFNEAHAQQRTKMIGGREDEIKNLEATIQQKTEQIRQLTQQIEEHRQRSEQLRSEINESTLKIETTKADFETTFALVAGQIQDDAAKIQQYLK